MVRVLHIIDASNQIYRCAVMGRTYTYGTEFDGYSYQTKSVPVSGVSALLNYPLMIERDFFSGPNVENHYAFCFDSRSKTIKRQNNPEYKSSRTYDPSLCVHPQLEYAEEVLKLYGYAALRVEGYEADDIAYTLWKTAKSDYDLIFLHSTDKDWAFMIDPDTTQFAKRKIKETGQYDYVAITPTNFTDIYNMQYNTMLMFKVLKGDPSDCISGIGVKNLKYIQDSIPSHITPEQMNDVQNVREILLAAGKAHPEFPVAKALEILNLVSPEYIDDDSLAAEVLESRPKRLPYNYLWTVKPQNRDDEHKDRFYDFVEATRAER